MTAPALARPWDPPVERFRLTPAEGWITLGMVALLVESFVWSLQDAGWVPDAQGSTAHLFFLALAAIFIEFVGAKAGWGRWRTHLLAGVIGGLVLPYVAAVTVLGVGSTAVDWTDVKGLYLYAGQIGYHVWADLFRDGKPFTTERGFSLEKMAVPEYPFLAAEFQYSWYPGRSISICPRSALVSCRHSTSGLCASRKG